MATVLDLGLLRFFIPVFTFLFILVLSYAVLSKTNFLKSKAVNITAAFAISILFLFTPEALELVQISIPWIMILILVLTVIFAIFIFLGVKEEEMGGVLKNPAVYWTILVLILAIFGFAATQLFGGAVQSIFGGGDSGDGGVVTDVGKIIFNPKVLGVLILILIASQAVRLIVSAEK